MTSFTRKFIKNRWARINLFSLSDQTDNLYFSQSCVCRTLMVLSLYYEITKCTWLLIESWHFFSFISLSPYRIQNVKRHVYLGWGEINNPTFSQWLMFIKLIYVSRLSNTHHSALGHCSDDVERREFLLDRNGYEIRKRSRTGTRDYSGNFNCHLSYRFLYFTTLIVV